MGDCESQNPPPASVFQNIDKIAQMAGEEEYCSEGCEISMLMDGNCDTLCNVPNCGFDTGDCEAFLEVIHPGVIVCEGVDEFPQRLVDNETLSHFVNDGWDVTPESFCLLRLATNDSFIQVDLSEYLEGKRVSSVVILEKGWVLERSLQ